MLALNHGGKGNGEVESIGLDAWSKKKERGKNYRATATTIKTLPTPGVLIPLSAASVAEAAQRNCQEVIASSATPEPEPTTKCVVSAWVSLFLARSSRVLTTVSVRPVPRFFTQEP